MKSEYSEKYKDPRWQKKRLEVLEKANWKCRDCGSSTATLHVHHSYYVAGRNPWEYPERTMMCLCEECHSDVHQNRNENGVQYVEEWEQFLAAFEPLENSISSPSKVAELANILVCFNGVQRSDLMNALEVFFADEDAVKKAIGKFWGDGK
jgi:hypothetical protein